LGDSAGTKMYFAYVSHQQFKPDNALKMQVEYFP
jgi:hypothetical protein